ncbi:MAG: hypothetical protein H8D26_00135, partial [Methanomicrobia archaeon]|nr:hypothetical protein [Methanomicrobia archaeon]
MLFKLPDVEKAQSAGLKAIKIKSISNAGWKEKDLENLLANNITQLIREEYLMTIGQERPLQEEPDILALDRQGTLYLFELKRDKAEEKNLLQVLKYGQKYGIYDYDRLNQLYTQYCGDNKKHNLQEEHKKYFNLVEKLDKSKFNTNQNFVIITEGLDVKTLRAIKYWKEMGLPIEALVYHIYEVGKEFVIDFNPYGSKDDFAMAETNNHVVNTNYSRWEDAYKEMIDEEKASAYGDRKTAVDSIQKNDRVFLYHTGVGICAVGRATHEVEEKDNRGIKG